jgi:tyramine---L-glutamate ligase
LKVIVYEYVSGGGYAGQAIPQAVLSEGFGMLRSLAADFEAAGHEVTVLLDSRLSKLNPPINAHFTVPIFYTGEPRKFLSSIAKINDAVYIIAPETEQTLQTLVELAEKTGKVSLNCESKAIRLVGDKAVLYEHLQKNCFPTPKTLVLNLNDSLSKLKKAITTEFDYPAVLKPVDGVGCAGLSIVKAEAQTGKAIAKIKAESKNPCFIAQEFINGESASVSLISTGKKAMALSLNRQNISLAGSDAVSSYEGGAVPFNHPLEQAAFALAEKVAESFPGLRGYIGVDLILMKDRVFVVDVNARLTTSYVGLRKVADFNVAEALVNSVLKGKLPGKTEIHGFACFSKMETATPAVNAFQKEANLDDVVSPLFPTDNNKKSCALVMGTGETLKQANLRLEEAKKHLRSIIT